MINLPCSLTERTTRLLDMEREFDNTDIIYAYPSLCNKFLCSCYRKTIFDTYVSCNLLQFEKTIGLGSEPTFNGSAFPLSILTARPEEAIGHPYQEFRKYAIFSRITWHATGKERISQFTGKI